MIEVTVTRYVKSNDVTTSVLVDADSASVRAFGADDGTGGTYLVLTLIKGNKTVATFREWDCAIETDNLMEYTDEQ